MTLETLAGFGHDVDDEAHARLKGFVAALLEENRRANLTAIRDVDAVWAVHVCDSLALLPLLDASGATKVLDLGTGGGVPGLPLACCRPRVQFTLVDATRKKVEAVRRIAETLRLMNVRCEWGRGETLSATPEHHEQYDALTARAVAALPDLVRWASGLVQPGGKCWFSKSLAAVPDEVAAAETAASRCGLAYAEARPYRLPPPHGERLILVYEKRGGSGD